VRYFLFLGTYTNDNFKLGYDLDTRRIFKKELSKHRTKLETATEEEDELQNKVTKRSQSNFSLNVNDSKVPKLAQLKRISNTNNITTTNNNNNNNNISDSFGMVEESTNLSSPISGNNLNNGFEYFSTSMSSTTQSSQASTTRISEFFDRVKKFIEIRRKWKNFLPVSSLIHLIIAFCLLFPNVLLVSKQIEYGLRPKGNL
jgi:hypothetical protein